MRIEELEAYMEEVWGKEAKKTINLTEYIMDACNSNNNHNLDGIIIQIFKRNHKAKIEFLLKLNQKYHSDAGLTVLSKYLKKSADDVISYKHYGDMKALYDGLCYIIQDLSYYSEEVKYDFAMSLEYLYAYGYKNLEFFIYETYSKIKTVPKRLYDEVSLSKKLSCVYLLNEDNYLKIFSICRKIEKQLIKNKQFDLLGQCYYYIGIIEDDIYATDRSYDCFKDADNYMSRSKKRGFKLAKTYIHHRMQKNSETLTRHKIPYKNWDFEGGGGKE